MDKLPLHFVISAPRSGSTWLTQALNHHPEIFATEHRLFGEFSEVWRNNDGSTAPRITADAYARAFAVHYFHDELGLNHGQFVDEFQDAFIRHLVEFAIKRSGKRIVVDKITPYPGTATKVVTQIKKRLPDSKVIQLVRDGRDVLTSGTFDWLLKDAEGTARHDFFVLEKANMTLQRFFDDTVIEKWALNWVETVDVFLQQPPDELIKFESMLDDQARELGKLFATLGADDDDRLAVECANAVTFRKMTGREAGNADPTAKARNGLAGDWVNFFTKKDGELFHQLAGEQLMRLGYVSNQDWFAILPDELKLERTAP